jgi:PAS domain S-box-containing protein
MSQTLSQSALEEENARLRVRLVQLDAELQAIGSGAADALIVGGRVYTLQGAETGHRVLVEAMSQGAGLLREDGTFFYANRCLADLLQRPLEALVGQSLGDWIADADRPGFAALLAAGRGGPAKAELYLARADGSLLPALLTLSPVAQGDESAICLVATDLTETKRVEAALREAHDSLEQTVRERTASLSQAVASMKESRRAALALMEDAVDAREVAERAGAAARASEERYRRLHQSMRDA